MAVPNERQCDYALLTSIMRKFEQSNRALIVKEQQLRQKLQTTRAMLDPRRCRSSTSEDTDTEDTDTEDTDTEDEVRCPHCCWPPPPPSEADTSSTCGCDTDDTDTEDECFPSPYFPAIAASDISIEVTPSASEASSLCSLQGEDIVYLQQMAMIAHDEHFRLARLERLKQRERDIMRTAQVTRDVVDKLAAIFCQAPRECRCAGAPATASAQEPSPEPPPPDTTTAQPVEEVPIEEVPAEEEEPAKEAPAEVLTEEVPPEELPVEEVPAEEVPTEEVPTEEVPAEEVPSEEVPAEDVPAEEVPSEDIWVDEVPPSQKSTQPVTAEPTKRATAAPTEEDAEIALLQQVLLDQTAQIRMLTDVVKQLAVAKHPPTCACEPCRGGRKAAASTPQPPRRLCQPCMGGA